MVSVIIPPFEPDKGRYNTSASPEIINAKPTIDGWGPLKGTTIVYGVYYLLANENLEPLLREDGNYIIVAEKLDTMSGNAVLPGDATGMFSCRKLDGTESIFASTATEIYLFGRSSLQWDDVSSMAYTGTRRRSWTRFGQTVLTQNGADPEQMINVDTDVAFSDNSTAPIANIIATVGDFVVRANLVGFKARVQWSAINDPTSNVATKKLSDYQDMPTGDECMAVVPLSGGMHIWMRSAIHGMAFALTSEFVFTRQALDEVVGTSAPDSVCLIGQDDYVIYADTGFIRFKGGFTNIGEGKVNKWFLANCDQNERENIVANLDVENNTVWFAYTDVNGVRKTLGYHYILDRWYLSNMQIQASCRARTFVYASQPPIVEEDAPRFAMINSDRRLAYLVGDNLAARLTTNEMDFAPDRSIVTEFMLTSDAQDFTVTHMMTDIRGGPFRTKSPAAPNSRTGRVPLRGDGRQHKFQIDIAAGEDWTTASGAEVTAKRTGRA